MSWQTNLSFFGYLRPIKSRPNCVTHTAIGARHCEFSARTASLLRDGGLEEVVVDFGGGAEVALDVAGGGSSRFCKVGAVG